MSLCIAYGKRSDLFGFYGICAYGPSRLCVVHRKRVEATGHNKQTITLMGLCGFHLSASFFFFTVVRLVHLKGRISALQVVVGNLLSVKRCIQLLYIVGFRLPHFVRTPSCDECAPRGLTLVL